MIFLNILNEFPKVLQSSVPLKKLVKLGNIKRKLKKNKNNKNEIINKINNERGINEDINRERRYGCY